MNTYDNGFFETGDLISLLEMIDHSIVIAMNIMNEKCSSDSPLMIDGFLVDLRLMILNKREELKDNKKEKDKNEST